MVKHNLKIFQQILQDFQSVFDHFGALCIKGFKVTKTFSLENIWFWVNMLFENVRNWKIDFL